MSPNPTSGSSSPAPQDDPVTAEAILGALVGVDHGLLEQHGLQGVCGGLRSAAAHVLDAHPGWGLLLASALAAGRWGVDLGPALMRLGEGTALRGAASDYELRTAAEEAEDALAGLPARAGDPSVRAVLDVLAPSGRVSVITQRDGLASLAHFARPVWATGLYVGWVGVDGP